MRYSRPALQRLFVYIFFISFLHRDYTDKIITNTRDNDYWTIIVRLIDSEFEYFRVLFFFFLQK